MCHCLGPHNTSKLRRIGHACDLPPDRIESSHYYRQQVVKVMRNPAGKLTDGFELLGLSQRCFRLVSARNFFCYTLLKRGIKLLKSQRRAGDFFARTIKGLSEVRCVTCRFDSRTFSRDGYMNPSFCLE